LGLAVTVGLASAADAWATPRGPRIGNNRYATSIEPVGQSATDTDDYVGHLYVRETLSFRVFAKRRSDLVPQVELLAPDGSPHALAPIVRRGGKSLAVRGFSVPETGRWTVRVSGADGTTGAYGVAFRVRQARPDVQRKLRIGGDQPDTFTHEFEAVAGAQLSVTLTSSRRGARARIVALEAPDGSAVPNVPAGAFDPPRRRSRPVRLRRLELQPADGLYRLVVGMDPGAGAKAATEGDGTSTYALRIVLRDADRPQRRKVVTLTPDEPVLDPVGAPIRGHEGRQATLAGANFSQDPLPTVYFGDVTAKVSGATPRTVSVVAPIGVPGSVVDVCVVNPDGQACQLDNAFHHVRAPEVWLAESRDGSSTAGGPRVGGAQIALRGSGFNSQDAVRFGATTAPAQLVSSGELLVTVPSVADEGAVGVFVTDEFGREAEAPFSYVYKDGPVVHGPYDPPAVKTDTPTVLTVSGSGFKPDDEVLVGGGLVTATFEDAGTLTVDLPALPAADYTVEVRDRFGTEVRGPDLMVKAPPVITDLQDDGGGSVRRTTIFGGEVLSLVGSGFDPQAEVSFGGIPAQVHAYVDTTRLDVVAPSSTGPQVVTISVTDVLGQSAAAPFSFEFGRRESQVSQYGITWTLSGTHHVGQFVNGDWWVVGPVTVDSVSPSPSGGRHGSVVNPEDGEPSGYDSRTPYYDGSLAASYPLALQAGDSLVSTISHTTSGAHFDLTGRSVSENNGYLRTAAVLTVLSTAVPKTSFRPPLVGTEKPIYDSADLDLDLLPRLDATDGALSLAAVPGKTPAEQFARYFQRPWIGHGYDYLARTMHPAENQPNYHREVYNLIADGAVLLLTDDEHVEDLLVNFVQVGIDMHYATKLGPIVDSSLHKWPIVLAGLMLDVDEMRSPTYRFRTDWMSYYASDATSTATSSIVPSGEGWTGATVLWCQDPGPAEHEHLHPTEWHLVTAGGDGMKREQYRRLNSHSWPGAALAALAMGAKDDWDHDAFFDYVDRWMTEPDTANFAYIETLFSPRTLTIPGGYVESEFVENMWNQYRSDY
jgi:hypothetical protein